MLTQAKISTVVTACQDVEDGMDKCLKYWTDAVDGKWHSSLPGFAVKLEARQQFEGFVVRDLLLKSSVVLAENKAHEVRQSHLTDWPDHGVPESAGPIVDLLDRVHKYMDMNRVGRLAGADQAIWQLLVHCSAGCGRTGTLIAIDQISEQRVHLIETCVSQLLLVSSLSGRIILMFY